MKRQRWSNSPPSPQIIHEHVEPENKVRERTPENSPAIYRWERSPDFRSQSAKRTTETICYTHNLGFSVARFTGSERGTRLFPALKVLGYFQIVRFADVNDKRFMNNPG